MRKIVLLLSALALALAIAPLTAASGATAYKISFSVGPDNIDVSHGSGNPAVTIRGTISGGPVSGKTVTISRINRDAAGNSHVNPDWEAVGTVVLGSSGKFSKTNHIKYGGYYSYKVEIAKSGSVDGALKTHHLYAYQWDYLSDFNIDLSSDLVGKQDPNAEYRDLERTTPNGSDAGRYYNAYWVKGGGTLEFNTLGHRCSKISFHVGVSTAVDVPDGTSYRYTVYKGDTKAFTHTMHQGQPVYLMDYDDRNSYGKGVDGVTRIKVSPVTSGPNVRFLIGLPKIFCNYPSDNLPH